MMAKSVLLHFKLLALVLVSMAVLARPAMQAADGSPITASKGLGVTAGYVNIYSEAENVSRRLLSGITGEQFIIHFTETPPAGYGDFLGYCCDIDHYISPDSGITYYGNPIMGSSSASPASGLPWVANGYAKASYLYSTHGTTLGSGTEGDAHATALQIAIWESLYNNSSQTWVQFSDNPNDAVQHHIYTDVTAWMAAAQSASVTDPNFYSYWNGQNTVWIENTQRDGLGARKQTLLGPNPVPEPGQIGLAMAILLGVWRGFERYKKRQVNRRPKV